MTNQDSIIYELDRTARYRSMCSVTAESGSSKLLVGSSMSKNNSFQLSLFEVDESKSLINCVRTWSYSTGFFNIASSPSDSKMFVSSFKGGDASVGEKVSLLFLGENEEDLCPLIRSDIASNLKDVCTIFWDSEETVCVADSRGLGMYSIEEGPMCHFELPNCVGVVSDPNCPFTLAACAGKSISLWDTRSGESTAVFATSNFFDITCIDANPVLPHVYSTGSIDGRIMFWDVRATTSTPLKCVETAHRHRVTSVKFNPLHDQLVLSAGTDCTVNLFKFPSIASSPGRFPSMMEKRFRAMSNSKSVLSLPQEPTSWPNDGLIQSISRHEDSVYKICWTNAWMFASLSHDGILLVNSVPSEEKYRIVVPCLKLRVLLFVLGNGRGETSRWIRCFDVSRHHGQHFAA